MRISLISGGFGPGGGTAGQAWLLARGLVRRGHDVEVWCRDPPHDGCDTRIVLRSLSRSRRALWQAARLPATGRLVHALERAPGAEIVRASGGVHRSWSMASRTSLMRTMIGHRPSERREGALEYCSAVRARLVVCNSVRVAGEVSGWHGVEPGHVRIVRNGVDLDRFVPDPRARALVRGEWNVSGRVAAFLADGWHRKNLVGAARAFARVAGPEDRLIVGGRGPRGLRLQVQRMLGRAVRFDGRVREPERWLVGADAVLVPTRYDASSNLILEAMACGVVPVTTGRDGASEIVAYPWQVVRDPDDVAGLAQALRRAWAGGGVARSRCRSAAERWPGSRIVDDMECIYMESSHG